MSIFRLPIIRHGQTAWDKALSPEAEFDRRLAKMRALINRENLAALFVYSDMIHSGRSAYLINCHVFDPRMPNMVLITPKAFDAVLNVTGRDLFFFSQFTKARLYNSDFLSGDMSVKLGALVEEHGLAGQRVGLVGGADMPPVQHAKFNALFAKGSITSCDAEFSALLREKSPVERELMKRAAEKVNAVLSDVLAHAKPGITEQALSARADYKARMLGCQDVDFLIHTADLSSRAAWPSGHLPFRPVGNRRLKQGDTVGIFVAMQYQGYWVELSRSACVGVESPEQRDGQNQARIKFAELLQSLRPGANYGADQMNGPHTNVWLHGTGGDRDEAPYFVGGEQKIAVGDLMAAHVAYHDDAGRVFFYGCQIGVSTNGGTPMSGPADASSSAA